MNAIAADPANRSPLENCASELNLDNLSISGMLALEDWPGDGSGNGKFRSQYNI